MLVLLKWLSSLFLADMATESSKSNASKNKGSNIGSKDVGNPLTSSDKKRAESVVDKSTSELNKFINVLQEGKGEAYEQIAADYGYRNDQLSGFTETAEFLLDNARSVADLLVQYKHGGDFIYSAYSGGDAETPGKIAVGKFGFDADTFIHEGAHKVFANAHGVDGTGNNAPTSRHTISSSRTVRDSLRAISSQARSQFAPYHDVNYDRVWLKNSAYRFEWSVSNASRK